jgi:CBS-domain-containing membrane protein
MEPAEIPISRIMHREYEHVAPATPLAEVLAKFSERGRHDLIVLEEDGTFVGVIMLIDILGCINPQMGIRGGRRSAGLLCMLRGADQTAGDLVTRSHIAIPADATVGGALTHMARDQHPYLVVVDAAGKAVGCIELADIIAFLLEAGHL